MSKALDIADTIASHLEAATALAGVPVIVDRQKDISSDVAKAIAKTGEVCLVILYEGFENPDADASASRPKVTRRYTVTVYARPVMKTTGGIPADDALEYAALALHNWEPQPSTDGFSQIHVTGGDMQPDPKYLKYVMDVKVLSAL